MVGRGTERGGRAAKRATVARRPERTRRTRPTTAQARSESRPGQQKKSRKRGGVLGLATTRRAAVVATVVCALALSVAVPLRNYLSQRTDLEAMEHRQAELHKQVDDLTRRKEQLADPEQIRVQARERLRYVMPGETPYMVELPPTANQGAGDQATTQPIPQQAWYQSLWDSVTGERR
ncbi:FtsB family cell division protein [Actinokineospora enzanensis]|uniref:FtsB family cell division protein n=1 Tax=Actinokineospora enzanensis TaxID=155975 RepID=UPI000367FB5B|nr:septum formation initiator family protein [Actinokineospora enzanensis]